MRSCCRCRSDGYPESGKSRKRTWRNLGLRLSASCEHWNSPNLKMSLAVTVRVCTNSPEALIETSVVPNRPTQSISVEDTFESDVLLADTESMIRAWRRSFGRFRGKNLGLRARWSSN